MMLSWILKKKFQLTESVCEGLPFFAHGIQQKFLLQIFVKTAKEDVVRNERLICRFVVSLLATWVAMGNTNKD